MSDLDETRLRSARSRPTALSPGQVRAARLACAASALGRWPGAEVRGLAVDDCAELLEALGIGHQNY